MRKAAVIIAAVATLGVTLAAAPAEARYYRGGGWGWGPGIGLGIVAGALAAGAAYGGYGPYGYGPGYGYGYGPRYAYGRGLMPITANRAIITGRGTTGLATIATTDAKARSEPPGLLLSVDAL